MLSGWDKTTNPFATGHPKVVQSGSDTLFQLDRDGGTAAGYSLSTLLPSTTPPLQPSPQRISDTRH